MKLKRVVFCIRHAGDGDRERVRRACKALSAQELQTEIITTPERTADLSTTLFLADDMDAIRALQENGAYVIGLQHAAAETAPAPAQDTAASAPAQDFSGVPYVFSEPDEVDLDSYVKAYERLAGLPWQILTTERLIVRETTVADVDAFYRIYAEPEITAHMEGLFPDPEDERRYMRDYIKKVYGLCGFGVWTIVRKEDGAVIGRAGYSMRRGFENAELGFLIGVPWQRRGYAREALTAILAYGKDMLGFDAVQALVKEDNPVSIHLLETLGFIKTDEVKIEEKIYGDQYRGEETVRFSPIYYGNYLRFLWNQTE